MSQNFADLDDVFADLDDDSEGFTVDPEEELEDDTTEAEDVSTAESPAAPREMRDDFVHLHTHLETSMLDGASRIPDAVQAAASLGQTALAITDHGRLGGTWKFVQECEKAGIKPILGIEAYVAIGSRFEKNEITIPGDDPTADGQKTKRYEHLTMLAATKEGWRNLVAMHNAAHESFWYYPRIDYDLMREHSEGIIILTGCLAGPVLGPVARHVAGEELREQAAEQAEELEPLIDQSRAALADRLDSVRRAVKEYTGGKVELGKMRPEELIEQALANLDEEASEQIALVREVQGHVERYTELRRQHRDLLHQASDHELEAARANIARLVDIFGSDNVYVELMEHGIPFETQAVPVVVELAEEFGLKCVATNDSHYTHEHDAEAHDAWLALQAGSGDKARVDNPDRFRFNGEGYFIRSGEQMRALRPEPWWAQAVANSAEVAAKVEADVLPERYMRLPKYPSPPGFDTSADYFKHLVKEGVFRRWGDDPSQEVKDRINYEVRTVVGMGLHDYFLTVQDVINWARSDYLAEDWIALQNGGEVDEEMRQRKKPILVGPGRGSAAGSAVSYALGIVGLDPVRFDLIFERFLDPTRVGMPDVDVDFERDRRAEVLNYLVQRWGRDKVAHIGAFATAKTRKALKDAARVLGVTPVMQNKLTKAVPLLDGKHPSIAVLFDPTRTEGGVVREVLEEIDLTQRAELASQNPHRAQRLINEAADRGEELTREEADALVEEKMEAHLAGGGALSQRIMTLAAAFENLTSGEGVHACGMLLADEPMTQMVPLRLDHKKGADPDAPAIALWDGKDVDSFGFLKLDVLGLRTLDLISAALDEASRLAGRQITVDDIPDGDDHDADGVNETWRLLQEGRTAGVFQLESSGMTELTENVAPDSLEDLSALVALYRPGPLSAGMHTHYADRKNGREEVDYGLFTNDPAETEVITEVLGSTYGLNVYQEQSMLLGQKVAGFGAPLTNRLRKAISKKNEAEFPELGRLFIEGAMRDHTEDGEPKLAFARPTAEALWDSIKGSAAYAFNKAHSAAYGYIGYLTAWIKANYPSAFGAGLLSVTKADDKRHATLASLRQQGIEVLQPDVNTSLASTSALDDQTVILGLSEIKGVGSVAHDIIAAREEGGPFTSTADLVTRVPELQSDKVATLAESGALDAFGPRFGQVMVARALRSRPETTIPDAEWGVLEKWVRQHQLLGVAVGGYPLADPDIQRQISQARRVHDDFGAFEDTKPVGLHRLAEVSDGDPYRSIITMGLVSGWSTRPLARGLMANLVLENSRARYDGVVWPRTMDRATSKQVGLGSIVEAEVRTKVREITTENDDGDVEITTKTELEVQNFWPLEIDERRRAARGADIAIDLRALCSGAILTADQQSAAAQAAPAKKSAPDPDPATDEPKLAPVTELVSANPEGINYRMTSPVRRKRIPPNDIRTHLLPVYPQFTRCSNEVGIYRVAGAWGQLWLRVVENNLPVDAPWDPPVELVDEPSAWELYAEPPRRRGVARTEITKLKEQYAAALLGQDTMEADLAAA